MEQRDLISLDKLNGIAIGKSAYGGSNQATMSLNAEMMRLGYIMSNELFDRISTLQTENLVLLYNRLIPVLRKFKGDDVSYVPMYPNFPTQVMEASDFELWANAMFHYWTFGQWRPDYVKVQKEFAFENTNFIEIGVVSNDAFMEIFTSLLGSNDSLSEKDVNTVKWFLNNFSGNELVFPINGIPFKENMCIAAVHMFKRQIRDQYTEKVMIMRMLEMIKTPTDLLRIITEINEGDVSLATNTKFKSLPRKQRRIFTKVLEAVINEEDIQRHRNKWNRLFHNLHVGEYSQKVADIARKVRSNKKLETTNGKVQEFIKDNNIPHAVELLMERPGDFARRLDHLMRICNNIGREYWIHILVNDFIKVAPQVSTKVLMQLIGHFNARNTLTERVVFPKGNVQKAYLLDGNLPKIDDNDLHRLKSGIRNTLIDRFRDFEPLGKVWIEDAMGKCPLPAQQRSASEGKDTVARGTRLPIGDDSTLRLFIYWVGQDIDLSVTIHDENFKNLGHVSYTNLRESKYGAYHSGDITRAPNGASEFIDLDINKMLKHGARYVVMSVYVFSGPDFVEHEKCYAGWMTRSEPNSNEIYEPKTVQSKVDLASESRNAIPVVFDLETREAIWTDLSTKMNIRHWGNNVESNKCTIEHVLKSMVSLGNKPTLLDLFTFHAIGRGEFAASKEDADIIFGWDGDVTPRDINIINSEYLV